MARTPDINIKVTIDGRHPSTQQLAQWFTYDHLAPGLPRDTSARFAALADQLIRDLPDTPELSAGLRKLLEAKDCAVRAAIAKGRDS